MNTIFEEVGDKISDFIEKNNMSQQDFANRIHVSKQVMSKIINGQKATNIEELQKIADVMNTTVDELIKRESQTSVMEEPILFMMEKTNSTKIRQHLQYLDFVMDEMIKLEDLVQTVRSGNSE